MCLSFRGSTINTTKKPSAYLCKNDGFCVNLEVKPDAIGNRKKWQNYRDLQVS